VKPGGRTEEKHVKLIRLADVRDETNSGSVLLKLLPTDGTYYIRRVASSSTLDLSLAGTG
jgi:hypothetical protein